MVAKDNKPYKNKKGKKKTRNYVKLKLCNELVQAMSSGDNFKTDRKSIRFSIYDIGMGQLKIVQKNDGHYSAVYKNKTYGDNWVFSFPQHLLNKFHWPIHLSSFALNIKSINQEVLIVSGVPMMGLGSELNPIEIAARKRPQPIQEPLKLAKHVGGNPVVLMEPTPQELKKCDKDEFQGIIEDIEILKKATEQINTIIKKGKFGVMAYHKISDRSRVTSIRPIIF